MKKRALAAIFALTACETANLPDGLQFARQGDAAVTGTIIATIPEGATLTHPNGTCETPCRVDYGERVTVTVGKEGYQALDVTIPAGAPDTTLELKPVGRSKPVEELALPDL